MPEIHYILADGTTRSVQAVSGASVMETAIKHNVRGIEAECGGCLSCATCHVYVDDAWVARLPEPETDEQEMLRFVASERLPSSRLSCQLVPDDTFEGLVLRIPAKQIAD